MQQLTVNIWDDYDSSKGETFIFIEESDEKIDAFGDIDLLLNEVMVIINEVSNSEYKMSIEKVGETDFEPLAMSFKHGSYRDKKIGIRGLDYDSREELLKELEQKDTGKFRFISES